MNIHSNNDDDVDDCTDNCSYVRVVAVDGDGSEYSQVSYASILLILGHFIGLTAIVRMCKHNTMDEGMKTEDGKNKVAGKAGEKKEVRRKRTKHFYYYDVRLYAKQTSVGKTKER